jgi:hypothetical protein
MCKTRSCSPSQRPQRLAVVTAGGEPEAPTVHPNPCTMTRQGFPSNRTLDGLIKATPPGPHRAFLEREASLTIDGALLRYEPFLQYTADPREHRGARPFLELLTLARGLAFLGYEQAVATRAKHPDFEVALTDSWSVGVEATDAFATGVYEGRLQKLRLELLNAVDASGCPLDGRLVTISSQRTWDSGIAVNLGAEPSVPAEALPFKDRDVDSFVKEFIAWITVGEHRCDRDTGVFNDPAYPNMTRWEIVVTSTSMTDTKDPGAVEFMLPNVGQSAEQLRKTILAALLRKQGKATNYGSSRPLWLFIELADRAVRAPRALEEFVRDGFALIAPYDLVVVIHHGTAIAVDSRGVRRMDLASSNRLVPFWPT